MTVADYVKEYNADHHILVHSIFHNILKQLPENQIIRIRKSYAVALDKVDMIARNILKIKGADIPTGQTYRLHLNLH